ncbi:hypothetical protein FG386_002654 [Cryptosporidium ryanae]|uniref:uncharacterized protein n=1 Tax=Cryptosporidium ryanae TaxID=515981 RepID=UPI003519E7FB|nr:hypothetical protein FG386_002654 [Cryptosporidium ryanae]
MKEKKVWGQRDVKEILKFVVDVFNEHETRDKIVEKLQQRTGLRQKHCINKLECNTEERNQIGILKFVKFDNELCDLINNSLFEGEIVKLLPKTIEKAFHAYTNLKDKCLRYQSNSCRGNKFNLAEYGFKLSIFTESLVLTFVDKLMILIKNSNKNYINDVSRWASPYCILNKKHRLTDFFYSDFSKFGASLFTSWLGENSRSNICYEVKKRDYQGLFIDKLGPCKNFRFIILENDEIKDELLYYLESIKQIPFEMNEKLKRNLNTLPNYLYITSLEPSKVGFIIQNGTEYFIPGSQICIVYFPFKES